jgi:Flp pilus assembly protein TadG
MNLFQRRRGRRSRGQAMVEFALVAPIFFVVLFGIIDMGRYVFTLNQLQQTAREAARVGTVPIRPVECNGLTRSACVKTVAVGRGVGLPITTGSVTVTCERIAADASITILTNTDDCSGTDMLVVKIQTNFNLVTPLIAQFVNTVGLNGEARMTVNQ